MTVHMSAATLDGLLEANQALVIRCERLQSEIDSLLREKEIWRRVCEFEHERHERFYKKMFVEDHSDFGKYLKYIQELAGKK